MDYTPFSLSVPKAKPRKVVNLNDINKCPNPYRETINLLDTSGRILIPLFFNICPVEDRIKFVEYLEEEYSNNSTDLKSEWCTHAFAMRFSSGKNNCEKKLFENILNQVNNQTVKDIQPYITGEKKITGKNWLNFCFFVLALKENFPVLYRIFNTEIQDILKQIKFTDVYTRMSTPALGIYNANDYNLLRDLDIPINDIREVIQDTQNEIVIKAIQDTILERFKYPLEQPKIPSSSLLSLTNTSIFSNVSFIDVVKDLFLEAITKPNIDVIPNVTRVFPSIVPYFLAAYQQIIYSDIGAFERLLKAKLPQTNALIIQERFMNDLNLLGTVNEFTGQDYDISVLMDNSLPFLFQNVLSIPFIIEPMKHKYYLYSDSQISNDYDFIFGYLAIRDFLSYLGVTTPVQKSRVIKSFEEIEQNLSNIKNTQTREIVALDLFSLIFLHKDGKLACQPVFADLLLWKLLQLFPKNKVFLRGRSSFIPPLEPTAILEQYIGRNRNALLKALAERDFDRASQLYDASTEYKKDFIAEGSSKPLHEFLENAKGKPDFENLYLNGILKSITETHNWRFITNLIFKYAINDRTRVSLFLEYDCLSECITFLDALDDDPLVPMIAHRASLFGQTDVANACLRKLNAQLIVFN